MIPPFREFRRVCRAKPLLWLVVVLLGFTLPAKAAQVVFGEVMYHPVGTKPEFIEVWNITATPLDMAKWRFTKGIDYTFPDFTPASPQAHFLKGNERIIVSSADVATTRAAYPTIPGAVRIFGPWAAGTSLDNSGERITLEDKNGVVMATLSYDRNYKWPIAPDGTGHSLVLANENMEQDDWRVWRQSTNNGGSPGVADPNPPAAGIMLNEVHFRSSDGHVDWVEIRNNSPTASQSAGSLFLASAADFSDKVSLSGTLTPGALATFSVNFPLDNNGEVRLYLTDASNNVRDAVRLKRKPGRDSWQVFPAGGREWYSDTISTQDAPNNPARYTDIVINEIMLDPPSNQRDGEFIELYNRGSAPVGVGGWKLADAIDYTIPGGTVMAPGEYLVVGANAAWLNANYSGLTALGNWSGNLRNGGDRIRLVDANGNLANQVDYRTGGEWPELAGGKGSSLELINPAIDNSVGSSWKDSDESAKSTFQSFTINGGTYRKISRGNVQDDEIQLWLPGDGHIVMKNVVLRPTAGGANLLTNGEVTTLNPNNIDGWQSRGNHWATYHDAEGVHILADGGGDNKCNHAEKAATGMSVTNYTLTFDARWIYGMPRVVVQSWDGSWGGTTLLPIPNNLGTPGAQNSRYRVTAPPEISGLRHVPAVPGTSSTVVVTAHVSSVTALDNVRLFHRLDNASYTGTWNSTTMVDNGTAGDAVAGDGTYTASIQLSSFGYAAAGAITEFYVRATAVNGETVDLPRGSVAPEPYPTAQPRRGLWVVDGAVPATDLRRIRVVVSNYWLDALTTPDISATPPGTGIPSNGGGSAKFNYKFPKLQSHYFPCTFIHNDSEVYYGSGVHKTGSPFTRSQDNSLDRARVLLPGDRLFRGKSRMYWDNDSSGGTMLHNRISRYWLYLLGVPGNENEVCRVTKNAGGYNVRETNEVFDKEMLSRIWENGNAGQFFELDDRHLIGDDGNIRIDSIESGWDYNPPNSPGADNPVSYHSNFVPNSLEADYDFSSIIDWNRQLETAGTTLEQFQRMADVRAMCAYAAVRGYTADWDNITMSRAKNGYFYNRSTDHKWMLIHWDSDNAFQSSHIDDAVIGSEVNVQGFYGNAKVRRYANYYLNEMITTYAANGPRLTAWLAAEEAASGSYPVSNVYAAWPNTTGGTGRTRHQVIQQDFIKATSFAAPFLITSPPSGINVTAAVLLVTGKAPINAYSVICVNHPEAVFSWTASSTDDVSPWQLDSIRLSSGPNTLTFRALNEAGVQVGTDVTLSLTKTNNAPPVVTPTSNPSSQNVALGSILNVDASASYDPDGLALTYAWSVNPSTGFAMTEQSPSSRNLVFNVPGTYTLTVEANDGTDTTSVQRTYTVYNGSEGDEFEGGTLADYAFTNLEPRDNYSPDAWYSLNETEGSLVLQLTDRSTFPVRVASPTFPRITRSLPATGDFSLQTSLSLEGRRFGTFITGLYMETTEGGSAVRYAFGLENGTTFRVMRAVGAGSYGSLASVPFTGGEVTIRIIRTGPAVAFQFRKDGAWTHVFQLNIATGTVQAGGIFAGTGPTNSASVSPGQGLRVAFDYLLLANSSSTANAVDNLRITELMYHPAGSPEVEFVELRNIGTAPLNVNGCYFESGLPFTSRLTFGNLTLQPGQFCVVTNDAEGFTDRYGAGTIVAGEYTGSLSNDGERIVLKDPVGNVILDFSYDDAAPWPTAADGQGPSLEAMVTDPALFGIGTNWRASQETGGSPGYLGLAVDADHDGFGDSLELAFGSDPANGASTPAVPQTARTAATGYVTITWESVPGRLYTIEYRNSLDIGTWLPLASKTATGPSSSYTDTAAAGQANRFYRVKTQFP